MSLESAASVCARSYHRPGFAHSPGNTLLSHVEQGLWADFREHFEALWLTSGDTPDVDGHVWFPTSAVLGLKVSGAGGETIDVALAGRDAVVASLPGLAQSSDPSSGRWIVRLGGTALRAPLNQLDRLKARSGPLAAAVERQETDRVSGLLQAALCASAHLLEGRMASLLLRLMDGAGRHELEISQETLAEMLGVQRTTLSAVASDLKTLHLIRYARGKIQVLDPEGLRHRACERLAGSTIPDDSVFRATQGRGRIANSGQHADAGILTPSDRSNSSP